MKRIRIPWLGIISFFVLLFAISPFLVIIPSAFTKESYLSFPPKGFSLQWFSKILERSEFIDAFVYSVKLAAVTSIFATILGTLAAIALAKYKFKGSQTVNMLLLSPLALPSLIIGIATLIYFTQIGIAGGFLGLLLGHLIITIPYVVRLVLTGMTGYNRNLENAASIMGASPIRVFWDITIPLIKPAVLSGMIFSFLLSFDNVTISLFLVSPTETTLPMKIFHYMEQDFDPLISAVSTAVILLSLVPVFILEKLYGLDRLFGLNSSSHS